MKKPIPFATLMIACTLSISGCKSSQPAPAPAQNPAPANSGQNGGTLNSDGTVAPPAQQPSQPAPAQDQPAPPPPPPPVTLTAPAGSRVQIRTTEALSASHNEVGDKFTGVLETPLVSGGKTLFPRGTRVSGTVIAAKRRGRFKGAGDLGIEVNTIADLKVQTDEYERQLKGKGKRTGVLAGGGAGLGAIIGGIAGGGKGAAIGALAGGGAGAAGAAYTGNKDVVIPSESLVTFHLAAPLTITQ